jgi:hypothetical protein
LKKLKHIIQPLLFLFIFIGGLGRDLIIAQPISLAHSNLKYSTSQSSSENLPFYFQPIEDFQDEDNAHFAIESEFHNYSLEQIILTNFVKKVYQN